MKNLLKKLIGWIYNPNRKPLRDQNGRVIDDWRRRRHSKKLDAKIATGEIKLEGESPRCYRLVNKGKVELIRPVKPS